MRTSVVVLVALLAGCSPRAIIGPSGPISVDPEANFAAHQVHQGFVVDRLLGGGTGTLDAPSWFGLGGGTTFVLEHEDSQLARIRLTAPATVVATRAHGAVARVEPSWQDNAIRLAFRMPDGSAFTTGTFDRTETSAGWSTISRGAQTILDLRGTFRAEVRDPAGKPAGWFRVRMSPYQESPRIFDGRFPGGVDDALAAAAVVALSSEVDWISSRVVDVYRGSGNGPLQQSVPLGR